MGWSRIWELLCSQESEFALGHFGGDAAIGSRQQGGFPKPFFAVASGLRGCSPETAAAHVPETSCNLEDHGKG